MSSEVYDNNMSLVNGHSYKDKKSTNTNLAILVSHHFNEPFKNPILYGRNVAKNLNELGNNNVLVQRLGDIFRGKRTWQEELEYNAVDKGSLCHTKSLLYKERWLGGACMHHRKTLWKSGTSTLG